ncbi:MAG: hypothetical protein KDK45_22600, partial [Leptospiraceae bacterium]|nr:hypothetical protein [Leptospiraceae bacterium]
MNTDNLFGIKIDQFSRYYITLLKSTILFRYGISDKEELKLSAKDADFLKGLEVVAMGEGKSMQDGLIVGTIRMGYGHHRMAYSLYSHSIQQKRTILHDILAIDSNEARAIKEIDGVYSYLSRLSSENGGIIEWLWGQLTSQGNANSLFLSVTLAEEYKRLVSGISPKLPYLSTYPINGQVAVAAGFSRVIHLIPDNFPQYYLLVPGALNLVQSPSSYMKFINMGVPKENLMVAGHWVSEPILTHLEE